LARVMIQNLMKSFGDVAAVKDLTIEARDKEFLVLLGPSGCGKTTALRCIAGLETPNSGKIFIGDRLVNDLPPKDRDIAMVFQSYALYPHMSVYDNLAFPLKMRNVPKQEIDGKIKKAADILRITHLLKRRPKQLSGGEQQRVALGRAIVREPKAFLMDEPLSNLDAKLRLHMRAELKNLQEELGITTVYVTHDQAEAMTMADRIAVLNRGELLQLGSPEEIYRTPSSSFVAGFMGSPPMNFIDCKLVEEEGRTFLDAGAFRLDVSDLAGSMREKTSELVLGFRPEDISVQDVPSPESVQAQVYVVEPLGSEVILDLKVGESLVKTRSPPDFTPTPGDKVHVLFRKSKLHVFDKKTERSIL